MGEAPPSVNPCHNALKTKGSAGAEPCSLTTGTGRRHIAFFFLLTRFDILGLV